MSMRRNDQLNDLDAASATGIAQAQTPASATTLTLNGALGTTLDIARLLLITTVSNESAKTLTFVGTDAEGNTITEVVTGPNATTAVTTKYYKTITSITTSAAFTGNVSIGTRGTTAVGAGKTIPLDFCDDTAARVVITVTGTINVTVQETFSNILADGTANAIWFPITGLTSKTANTVDAAQRGATGVRVLVNTYSTGADVTLTVIPNASGH